MCGCNFHTQSSPRCVRLAKAAPAQTSHVGSNGMCLQVASQASTSGWCLQRASSPDISSCFLPGRWPAYGSTIHMQGTCAFVLQAGWSHKHRSLRTAWTGSSAGRIHLTPSCSKAKPVCLQYSSTVSQLVLQSCCLNHQQQRCLPTSAPVVFPAAKAQTARLLAAVSLSTAQTYSLRPLLLTGSAAAAAAVQNNLQ